jgi:hypothetical protein
LFGKARVLESTGKLAEATAAYQQLNTEFPKGTYTAIAEQRLEQLGKPDTAELYQALAQYSPKPKTEKPKTEIPKEAEKAAAGPRTKLENMTLPENPEEPAPPKTSGKAEPSNSGAAASAPRTTVAPAAPAAPAATSAAPKPEAPKPTAARPVDTAMPAASSAAPAKK